MKSIISLFLLSSIFILSSCSVDWNGERKKENDLFNKKQECASNKDEMEKDGYKEIESVARKTGDAYRGEISEIFYSKSLNTCIYVFNIYKIVNITFEGEEMLLSTRVYDFLTKKEIISSLEYKDNEISDKIKELKGE